jgi:para-nitrobenzyl esterase
MQQYWTNFAKTGNPNGEGLPEWPRFAASGQQIMELGDATQPIAVLDLQRKALFDAYLTTRLPQ